MAEGFSWRVFGDSTLACLLAPSEVPGWLNKRVLVMPGECAVVIKNARVEEVITQERVKLPGFLKDLGNKFASIVGRDEQIDVLMVDTSLRDLPLEVSFVAKDMEVVRGEAVGRMRIDLHSAPLLLQTIKRNNASGSQKRPEALSVFDVQERLRVDWSARVIDPALVQYTSTEFRGNVKLLEDIEQASRAKLQALLSEWGIALESFAITWALTEAQEQQVLINHKKREEELKDFDNGLAIAELRRANQIDAAHIENMQRLKTLATGGEEEERNLVLRYELGRVAMADDQRLNTMTIETRIHALKTEMSKREVELDIYRRAQEAKVETDKKRDEAHIETEQATSLFQMVQKAKRDREELQHQYETNTLKMQTDAQVQMTREALERGVDPSKLGSFYREQTLQRMADRSDDKVSSMSAAEAARYSVDTLKEAEDRERLHQQHMTGLSADMMQAAKQNLPNTLVQGGSPSTHVFVDAPAAVPGGAGNCACGAALQPGWKVCPACGAPVPVAKPVSACKQCGAVLQPGWKVCPMCGTKVVASCLQCKAEVQPGWKACPHCGARLA